MTKAAGGLAIKTSQDTTYQINENQAKRHGHEPFKEGDHVTLVLDENDTLIDVHPEGQKGRASICDGKLIHLGKCKRKSNWQLLKAKRYSRVANLEGKTKGIKERTAVTVEVNEAGTVIDVHRGQAPLSTHEALLFRTGKRAHVRETMK